MDFVCGDFIVPIVVFGLTSLVAAVLLDVVLGYPAIFYLFFLLNIVVTMGALVAGRITRKMLKANTILPGDLISRAALSPAPQWKYLPLTAVEDGASEVLYYNVLGAHLPQYTEEVRRVSAAATRVYRARLELTEAPAEQFKEALAKLQESVAEDLDALAEGKRKWREESQRREQEEERLAKEKLEEEQKAKEARALALLTQEDVTVESNPHLTKIGLPS